MNVTHVASTLIYLEWFPGDEDATYTVVVREQGGSGTEPRRLTVIGNKVFVMDLNPRSTYCLSVSAGVQPESDPVCVRTESESHLW